MIWTNLITFQTRATLATLSLTLAAFILLLYVSCLEHVRSVRPSTLLSVYFGVSTLLDLARVRTLYFVSAPHVVAKIYTASFSIKLVIFFLEITEKRSLLQSQWQYMSPEATSGSYNRALFIWLNKLFFKGFRTLLTIETLMPLDADLLAASRPSKLIQRWEQGA